MTKTIRLSLAVLASGLFFVPVANAQMMTGQLSDDHTAKEEAQGKEIWQKLRDKVITCSKLTDDDFDALGEYFMGQMMGTAHEAMNLMMTRMMGEEGERQMHIVMGERLSGCNTSATFSSSALGFMPMMQMMWGGWGNMMGNWGNPWYGTGSIYDVLATLFWIGLLVLLFLVIVKLWRSINREDKNKK